MLVLIIINCKINKFNDMVTPNPESTALVSANYHFYGMIHVLTHILPVELGLIKSWRIGRPPSQINFSNVF